ncbi:MAG: FAD-binding oxidoreductase [Betaproteobacteria bacterium]|nr:FAD-binding oxidoreductase [Betaproteobacteria bacterium]
MVGASVAYWLTRLNPSISVALIERDKSFARASSSLSASSIRQQFSNPLNIHMSRFGLGFLREMGAALEDKGYLYLGAAAPLRAVHKLQRANGADVVLIAPADLAARFPWLNVAGIELGSLGLSGEGWFDGPALHAEVLRRAQAQGARQIEGEAQGFQRDANGRISAVLLAGGSRIECGHAVNAAGPWARSLASAAGIALPVHARRRTVFVLSCPQALANCPLVIDPSGFWFRPEGRYFVAGTTPDPDVDDLPLEPNYAEFNEALWSRMAHRVPAFAALRVERAWAGYYEMNLFDANAIIGAHPAVPNLWFANGFSGHGMQQAPAAGRGIAELILRGRFETLDLAPLGFQRLIDNRPMTESNIIG